MYSDADSAEPIRADYSDSYSLPRPDGVRRISISTAVQYHNRLGRIYFALIRPFHRIIIRRMLRRIASSVG